MVSIIGPSGSGKSTLLNLVGGLDRPTSGEVRVGGQALGGLSDDDLTKVRRDTIGFIFQFFNLLPTLSCLENVGLPLHLRGWPRTRVQERATELLTLVQLAIACSTCRRSSPAASASASPSHARSRSIRRCCSPTSRPATSIRVPAKRSSRSSGTCTSVSGSTVVIVTHDMNVARSCSRTITLRDGQIVEDVRRSA